MKRTITQLKSNHSVALPPALAGVYVIHFQGVLMFIKQCELLGPPTLVSLTMRRFPASFLSGKFVKNPRTDILLMATK
jgi:hypothetical protein